MLIDSVKGVEPQTIKLFQVCRMRGIPIVTFINKMDRGGKEPLELLDEIERVLGIPCSPVNWPIGIGPELLGRLRPLAASRLLRFERADGGARARADDRRSRSTIRTLREALGADALRSSSATSSSCSRRAGNAFDTERVPARRASRRCSSAAP